MQTEQDLIDQEPGSTPKKKKRQIGIEIEEVEQATDRQLDKADGDALASPQLRLPT